MKFNLFPCLLCYLFLGLFLSACSSSKIYTDRSQFIKDGETVPVIQLDRYKSVQLRPDQDSTLALAVSISGGGSRAANFAVGVLMGLEKVYRTANPGILQEYDCGTDPKSIISGAKQRSILREIDYLSTVSGGGFAGGAFIASLWDHNHKGIAEPYSLSSCVEEHICKDLKHSYVKTLIGALFNPRIWFTYFDDGDALEKVIDDLVLGYKRQKKWAEQKGGKAKSISLGDLFVDRDSLSKPVKFPMMVANASLLDKMGVFPFTPDILKQYKINGYSHRMKKYMYEAEEFDIYEMPLSVGIKASGSFPALISNTTLCSSHNPHRKYLHIIDGAMTDNFGFQTAVSLLVQDHKAYQKVLMVIDAENAGNMPTFNRKQNARLSFKVYGRLASSGLEARRLSLLNDLSEMGETLGFAPILFSFSCLIADNEELPPPVIESKKEQKRLITLLQTDMQGLSQTDLQILYELVTNISTKYTITNNEQELLLLTGQKIVQMQKKEIRAALGY